jgi:RNA polymerase sigma-70 factor (ECF subfamily)
MSGATDGAVLRRVYRCHVDAVFAFFASVVDRHTAEDLTASTFERVIRSWDGYDPGLGSERAWLMAIARNLLRDHFRRARFRVGASLDEHPALAEHLMVADDGIDRLLSVAELHAWLGCLGEREREILALRYGADLPAADVAALVGLTPSNVHQIVSRALRRLRQEAERTASTGARGA